MEKMTVTNMIENCVVGTDPIIELNTCDIRGHVVNTEYYNADNLPWRKYGELPVSYIELAKQFDGSTALIFTVYDEMTGGSDNDN